MNIELLKALVAATAANSFMYTGAADHGPLVAAEFALLNAQMVNPDGSGGIATRATPKGIEYVNTLAAQTYMILFIIIFIQFRPKGIVALKGRAAGN